MERLANQAYANVPLEASSLQKAEILCRQLASWTGSYCLTEALELSPPQGAYDKVKEVALRLERSLKAAEECGGPRRAKRPERTVVRTASSYKPDIKMYGSREKGGEAGKSETVPMEHRREEGGPSQSGGTHQRKINGRADVESKRCFNCGELGHFVKDCRVQSVRPRVSATSSSRIEEQTGAYATLVDRWIGATITEVQPSASKLFGKKAVADVKIFGMDAVALLDTGSQTTIIPLMLLKRAMEAKVNLDDYVTRIPDPEVQVRDASGNVMKFLDVIRVPVTFRGRQENVAAYVGRGLDDIVILGTNALEAFDVRLQQGVVETGQDHDVCEDPVGEEGDKAIVTQRLFIPARAFGTLTLACTSVGEECRFLQSSDSRVDDGLCCVAGGMVNVPVFNSSNEAMVFKVGEELAQSCARDFNERYREKMKEAYDKRNNVDPKRLPKVGDRVLLKLPKEKAARQYPKLAEPWGGPYRVATIKGDDTGALGLFFKCPGRQRSHDIVFGCSIREKTLKDVLPEALETIGQLRFDTVFSLARLISIYEHERCPERRRFLMMDPTHVFITMSGVKKAFLYFKNCCDHVFHALATHDGSPLALPHDGGTGLPIEQLNEANNEAVRFAKGNSWDDVDKGEEASKLLLLLPDGFSMIETFFKEQPNVRRQVYRELSEISGILERSDERRCLVVGPTTDTVIPKKTWCRVATSLAEAARNGVKVLAVAPPRGDKAYERNRTDLNEAMELAKAGAALAKKNLVSLVPAIESGREPSHGPSARPRRSASENYSKGVINDYFAALRSYVKADLEIPPLEEKISRSARTRNYFKDKKAGRNVSEPRRILSFRNGSQPIAMAVQPQVYPYPVQGQCGVFSSFAPYPGFGQSRGRKGPYTRQRHWKKF
ncbi:unnamed protein product [Heligmosomoides polygyrus]|uniref:CCHC-type domain-containing protein n=1 Tax=Heligmosomoides polygyrus TaxID=6339 RepID=A0A3P8AKI1_HELPZ|nr:unnamed protein product [Heligmosomoides polygyrus]